MAKRGLCLLLALATVFSLTAPAFAEEEPVTAEEPVVTEEPVIEPEETAEETTEPVEEPAEEPVEATEEPVVTEEPVEEPEAEPETAATSGTCGEGVTWTLTDDGTLTISGTGAMTDYSYSHEAPWYDSRDKIIEVAINSGVTTIGDMAFHRCASLMNVTIPKSVATIGSEAFYDCKALPSVTIPDGVTRIGEFAFDGCRSLTSITIPNSVTSIGGNAFQNCDGLTSITIPASVTSIDGGITFNALNLTDIYVANGNKNYASVDGVLFNSDKTELICYPHGKTATSYAIPNTVKSIGDWAFANCFGLTHVTIPNGVTNIGGDAFMNCAYLTGVTIPASVTSIGNSAFEDTPWLKAQGDFVIINGILLKYQGPEANVTIPNSVTTVAGSAFLRCESLTSVVVPNSVTDIGGNAFYACNSLTSVMLPDSLTSIGSQAFYYCVGLTNVTIPASMTSLGAHAFCGCKSLTSVTVWSPNCVIRDAPGDGTTLGVPGTTVVHGYDSSTAEAYAKQYGYKFESLGKAPGSTTPTATPKPQLAAPTVKIEKVSTGIKVSWNKVAGSPRYMVYYKEGNGSWKKIGTTTSTTYTRKAAQLKNGVTYTFTVRCCANDKKTLLGPYKASNALKYTAQLAAPTVKIAKVSTGIKVTWNKVTGSPRYMVYYKEGNGGWKKIGTTTATSYTRAAKYLKNNVTYTFTVRCCENDKKTLLGPYKASNSLKYKK